MHHAGSSPSLAHTHLSDRRPTFGLNLADQMVRDDVDVPPIVIKCCEVIEKYGLDQQGIYRVGGTHSKVMKLKNQLDRGTCFSEIPLLRSRSPPGTREALNILGTERLATRP